MSEECFEGITGGAVFPGDINVLRESFMQPVHEIEGVGVFDGGGGEAGVFEGGNGGCAFHQGHDCFGDAVEF